MNQTLLLIMAFGIAFLLCIGVWIMGRYRSPAKHPSSELLILQELTALRQVMQEQREAYHEHRQRLDQHQIQSLKLLQDSLLTGIESLQQQVRMTLTYQSDQLGQRLDKLIAGTEQQLKEINAHVADKLAAGFEKTTATFTEVVTRLSLIDAAQKKITELSSNVISLQEILSDKRSRGAFGEVQLMGLIQNMLPDAHYRMQHTLSNGKRCDCLLLLPEPTGNIAIDAKFPLESYQHIYSTTLSDTQRQQAEQQFRLDVRKHIRDIAEKYILPGETANGAMMFIPAEAIFAEIHAHHPELVSMAHKTNVWLVSPTTMMAILTTAASVLKDAATRKQVHIIQEHLIALAKDFNRFEKRMEALARHIHQAHEDVTEVHQSSKKITSRFNKIERVELESLSGVSSTAVLESE